MREDNVFSYNIPFDNEKVIESRINSKKTFAKDKFTLNVHFAPLSKYRIVLYRLDRLSCVK